MLLLKGPQSIYLSTCKGLFTCRMKIALLQHAELTLQAKDNRTFHLYRASIMGSLQIGIGMRSLSMQFIFSCTLSWWKVVNVDGRSRSCCFSRDGWGVLALVISQPLFHWVIFSSLIITAKGTVLISRRANPVVLYILAIPFKLLSRKTSIGKFVPQYQY